MIRSLAAALLAGALLLAGCSDVRDDAAAPAPSETPDGHAHAPGAVEEPDPTPLRKGERFLDLQMPESYAPSAPNGVGTDDYRCFLLDPRLTRDTFLTGLTVEPGNADVVHHVILFQVPPTDLAAARQADAADQGQGWTCFGGSGLRTQSASLDSAPWIGAWAPGGGETVHERGVGIPLARGTRIVMQVHYNLVAGTEPDTSSARLRLAREGADLTPLETVLLPAPVELPCRPSATGDLCRREDAMADVKQRFGAQAGALGDLLHLLCGPIQAAETQSCTRRAPYPMTVRAVAGHMHLLGREISIEVAGRRILDIDNWDFDNQASRPVDPVRVRRGDRITVTCRHDQSLRDRLPAFEGQQERYVVWGEGTTDEMCLGVLLATRA